MNPSLGLRGAIVLLIATFCLGCGTVHSEVAVRNVHTVVPGVLVRGGQPDEQGFRALRDTYGISMVVNLNDAMAERERPMVEGCGMTYVPLPSDARRPEREKVLKFLRAVQEAKGRGAVYVHCKQGMDRTGLAVAAYRITAQGWDCERALAELRGYQAFGHGMMFPNIPTYVRNIARDCQDWQRQVAASSGSDAPLAARLASR